MKNFYFSLTCLLVVSFSPAGKAADYQRTFAVVVAVADYQHFRPGAGDLRYTVNDADLFTGYLMSTTGGAVPREHIRLLKNQQATRKNIIEQVRRTFALAGRNDRVIFYFSGHGKGGYLLPYDTRGRKNLVSYGELKKLFAGSEAENKLCLIDACNSNSLKGFEKLTRAAEKEPPTESIAVAIMVSSQAYQTSLETTRLKQGTFSYFLIEGLNGKADLNRDRRITIAELHTYVYARVKQDTGGRQLPHTFGRFDHDMVVATLRP